MGTVRPIIVALVVALGAAFARTAEGQDRESTIYSNARDCSGLRAYLRAFPSGRFKADAEARVSRECAGPNPAPALKPAVSTAPAADPCDDARNEWRSIDGTQSLRVLGTFLDQTPTSCVVLRAQVENRIETIKAEVAAEAAEARRQADVAAYRVQGGDFVGTWIRITGNEGKGVSCPLWYQFVRESSGTKIYFGNGEIKYPKMGYGNVFKIDSVDPPVLKSESGTTFKIEHGRLTLFSGSLQSCAWIKQ